MMTQQATRYNNYVRPLQSCVQPTIWSTVAIEDVSQNQISRKTSTKLSIHTSGLAPIKRHTFSHVWLWNSINGKWFQVKKASLDPIVRASVALHPHGIFFLFYHIDPMTQMRRKICNLTQGRMRMPFDRKRAKKINKITGPCVLSACDRKWPIGRGRRKIKELNLKFNLT